MSSLACVMASVRQMSTGLACVMASVRQMSQFWHVVRQMSQGLACGASDVTGLACGASDVTGLACGASDVTGLHVSWRLCVRCHRFGMWWRQMSQVWHVVRQMSQVWHVSWRLCVRCHRFGMCHGICASDVMASVHQMSWSRNVKTAAADICSLEVVELRL